MLELNYRHAHNAKPHALVCLTECIYRMQLYFYTPTSMRAYISHYTWAIDSNEINFAAQPIKPDNAHNYDITMVNDL